MNRLIALALLFAVLLATSGCGSERTEPLKKTDRHFTTDRVPNPRKK